MLNTGTCTYLFISFSTANADKDVETSEKVYRNSCKKFGVTPRNRVLNNLKTDKLSITDGRLACYDVQPLAYSLTVS